MRSVTRYRMGMNSVLHGSCLCGDIQFELTGSPERFGFDHCSRCRKASGSAFAAWLIGRAADFRFIQGAESVRVFELPVRDTPPGYPHAFCGRCGGAAPMVFGDIVGIPAGTLDGDPGIRPQGHVFVEFKAPWFEITDSLPRFAREAKL